MAAIEQTDSSSSPQIDETDTDSRNEGKIEETTNIIPVLTPPLPFPSTLFSDVSSEEKCGDEDNVDKLDEIVNQLDPPSEGSETPPPLSQIQKTKKKLISPTRIRPATTFPSVVQNNIVYKTTIISNVGNVSKVSQAFRDVTEVTTSVSQTANTNAEVYTANSAATQRHQRSPTTQTPQTSKKKRPRPAQTPQPLNKGKRKPPGKSGESRNSETDEEERTSSHTPRQWNSESDEEERTSSGRPQQWNSDSGEEERLPPRTPRRWNSESDKEEPSSSSRPRRWNSGSDEEEPSSSRTPQQWNSDNDEERLSSRSPRRWNSESDEEEHPWSRRPRRWNSESDEEELFSSPKPRRWNSESDEERSSSRRPRRCNSESDEEERPRAHQYTQRGTSTISKIPSQPYRPSQSVERPQPHSSDPTQPSIDPAQSARTSGESLNSERSSSLTPQQYTTLHQQSPTFPSMLSGIPSQPHGPSQSVERPQPHSSDPTQPSTFPALSPRTSGESWNLEHSSSLTPQQYTSSPLPQPVPTTPSMYSGSYRLPGATTPQGHSMFAGGSQPFVSRTWGSPVGHVPQPSSSRNPLQDGPYSQPAAYNSNGQNTTIPQTYGNANGFVASDPFRVIDRNEKVDAPSDGLTFDDIPTASRRSQFYGNPHMPPQWRSTGTAMPTPQASQPINTGMAMPTPQASQPNNTGMAMPTPQASQPIYTGSPQQFVQQSTSQFYFFFAGFLKQVYLLLLLRLPSLYFSRVARIFEEADMSLSEIKRMALETASKGLTHEYEMEMAFESSSVPHAYKSLASTWECFIDSIMREWKTFNIISVLLLSYVTFDLSIFLLNLILA